jgi:hypothetical protein
MLTTSPNGLGDDLRERFGPHECCGVFVPLLDVLADMAMVKRSSTRTLAQDAHEQQEMRGQGGRGAQQPVSGARDRTR